MTDTIEAAAEEYAEKALENPPYPDGDEPIAKFDSIDLEKAFKAGDSHGFKRAMESAEVKGLVDVLEQLSTEGNVKAHNAIAAFKAKGE